MTVALKAAGLKLGENVLTNTFTLAPVPGSISNAGGTPIFIEITKDLVLDLDDLSNKASESGARFLLISHMRGHLVDMDKLMQIVNEKKLILIEDCAHTMGAQWKKQKSGNFGLAGCFSTQTYKHLNSGEGGLLTSNDEEFMARAIIYSGSYMLYERHGAAPSTEVFSDIRLETPNYSGRMDNLRASILRPQLKNLEKNISRWNERYKFLEKKLKEVNCIELPSRLEQERYVGSSIQFRIPKISISKAISFIKLNKSLGVELKWFGNDDPNGFTSNHKSWKYIKKQNLAKSDEILLRLFDLRLPLTFSINDCNTIGDIIIDCAEKLISND